MKSRISIEIEHHPATRAWGRFIHFVRGLEDSYGIRNVRWEAEENPDDSYQPKHRNEET